MPRRELELLGRLGLISVESEHGARQMRERGKIAVALELLAREDGRVSQRLGSLLRRCPSDERVERQPHVVERTPTRVDPVYARPRQESRLDELVEEGDLLRGADAKLGH